MLRVRGGGCGGEFGEEETIGVAVERGASGCEDIGKEDVLLFADRGPDLAWVAFLGASVVCVRVSFDLARIRCMCSRETPSSGSVTLLPVLESLLLAALWPLSELGCRDRSVAEREAGEPAV